MSIISEEINIGDFLKEVSEEAKHLQSTVEVANKEKYNIRDRFKRYKDDPKWLTDRSRECCNLATVRKRHEDLKIRASDPRKKSMGNFKYALSDAPWRHAMAKKEEKALKEESTDEPMDAIAEEITQPEVIITIHYHKPLVGRQKLSVYREVQVLGNTLLTQLRDYLPCVSDEVLLERIESLEEQAYEVEKKSAKSTYKSGYLFIEDVFYNDFRDPQNIDYSRVVLDWAEKKKSEVGNFRSTNMAGVRMKDLCVRQHKPYLYCHQGDCEHIITFTDIRLLNPSTDTTDASKYPLETLRRGERKPLCSVCHLGQVRWLVMNGRLCPEIPCFFCNSCINMLYCSQDGKLLDPSTVVHLYPRIERY